MAKNLTLFPVLTKKCVREVFNVEPPLLRYSRDGVSYDLKLNELDSSVSSVSDENGRWNPDEYDLSIEWRLSYKNASCLYDVEDWESACACHDAKIGIALSWFSSNSRRRSTIPVATLEKDNLEHDVVCIRHFGIAELRGNVGFSLVIYLKEAGDPNEDEKHFVNIPGAILGEIKTITLSLDGRGSFFTICEVNRPGQPLWEIEYDMDDPSTDSFTDCVTICLNRANKKFPLVKRDSGKFCQQMLLEIVGNSMATLIEMVRSYEKSDNFDCLSDFEEGSVAQALAYFRDKLLWDFSTPITVNRSARMFMEKNMKSYENN